MGILDTFIKGSVTGAVGPGVLLLLASAFSDDKEEEADSDD